MSATIRFTWQTAYRAKEALFDYAKGSPLFKVTEPSYANRISAIDRHIYHPVRYDATNIFHYRLRNALAHKNFGKLSGNRFPYEADIATLGVTKFSAHIQLFLPNTVVVNIKCHNPILLDATKAFSQRKFANHHLLKFIADFAFSQIVGDQQFTSQTRPLIHVNTDEEGETFFERHSNFLAALLINDEAHEHSDPIVLKKIYSENEEHNAKFKQIRQVLYNKQGFLAAKAKTPSGNIKQQVELEIERKERLYTLATALQHFYADYPNLRGRNQVEMDYLFFATAAYIEEPALVFSNSVTGTYAWMCLLGILNLKNAFDRAERFDVSVRSPMSLLFDQLDDREYTKAGFWQKIKNTLGDDYMKEATAGYVVNIQNNQGSVAAGPGATANTIVISDEKRSEVEERLVKLEKLGAEYRLPVEILRAEVTKPKPDRGIVTKVLENLQEISVNAAGGVAAALVMELAKLLL